MTKTSSKTEIKGSKKSAAVFQRQAKLLHDQAASRRKGRRNLKIQYNNALSRNKDVRLSVVDDLLEGFNVSNENYDRSEKDATSNLGETASSSRLNRARESSSAIAELSNMGGGLTDKIKAMIPAIRNMKANLDNGVNDYSNAITSLNNDIGITNANTSRDINDSLRNEDTSNASAFAEWSAGNQQAYADLVDLYGQIGAAHESAADALADKTSKVKGNANTKGTKTKSKQDDDIDYGKDGKKELKYVQMAYDNSAKNANLLAEQMGKTYQGDALTIDEMNAQNAPDRQFHDAALKANQSNLSQLSNAGTLRKVADAEGSKLRKKVFV